MIVHLCDDLIFGSRVSGTARDLGLNCVSARDADVLRRHCAANAVSCVIVDLASAGLDLPTMLAELANLPYRPRVVAYGSHVDVAGLRAARRAGCDVVMPRSQFAEELPTTLADWAA